MPDGIASKDVKFLGVVQSYNEEKRFGMVVSDEATSMWGQEIYAFRDVLATVDANVGDAIRFGIHLNNKGLPQVSLPIFKIGEDGQPIDVPPNTNFVNCEECALQDPAFLEKLKAEIEGRSAAQNHKRKAMDGKGMGKGMGGKGGLDGSGMDMEMGMAKRMRDQSWGKGGGNGQQWGGNNDGMWGAAGNFGGNSGWGGGGMSQTMMQQQGSNWSEGGGFTMHIAGLPAGVQKREVAHIFRQYAGFQSLRLAPRGDHSLGFVTFATAAQAKFVAEAVTGYAFDEDGPMMPGNMLTLAPANQRRRD